MNETATSGSGTKRKDLTDPASYPAVQDLHAECDLVMKGGITSGVIYPHAVCELATTRRVRNVGGTSAGAIAAGAAAAAETGRATGGFAKLAALPGWLSGTGAGDHTNLYHLFQAQPKTRAVYRFLAIFIGRGGALSKALRAIVAGLRLLRPIPFLLVVGPPIVLLVLAILDGGWVGIVASIVLTLIALASAFVWSLITGLKRGVEANELGLCTGMQGQGSGTAPPLTQWLADTFDDLAGHVDESRPVTFGDLQDAGVELAMLTTNLTLTTQQKLPFTSRIWAFDPKEMRRLFPERIVKWMEDNPPAARNKKEQAVWDEFKQAGLCPLPDENQLPIVIGVRMSLSFPILLSTVPLHAYDYTVKPARIVRHRFSDGGVTSNFPMHFFDRAVPGRPTFGINLIGTEKVSPNNADNISMPDDNSSGILARPTEIDTLGGFIGALKNTMQNWADAMQTHVPGYRDRIVAVEHDANEGGLNLDMDAKVVLRLVDRGRYAGERANRFNFGNHRWVRFRSFVQLLEDFVVPAASTMQDPDPGTGVLTYQQLMSDPPSYKEGWSKERGDRIVAAIAELADAYEQELADDGTSRLGEGAPRPTPQLQIRPKL